LAADRAFGDQPGEFLAERGEAMPAGDRVDRHEADIVTVVLVLVPGIAEANEELRRVGSGRVRGRANPVPIEGQSFVSASAGAASSSASAAPSSERMPEGATIVAIVKSRS